MRTLILIGIIAAGLVVAGAVHISQSNGQIEISIDKQKVRNVATSVAREGEDILRNAAAGQTDTRTK